MQFEFDWDPAKAESNRCKHGVAFEAAMGVFGDPLALSLVTMSLARGRTMGNHGPEPGWQPVHVYVELSADRVAIRIISARQPTRREIKSYEDG